jgi:hypothetical protein
VKPMFLYAEMYVAYPSKMGFVAFFELQHS